MLKFAYLPVLVYLQRYLQATTQVDWQVFCMVDEWIIQCQDIDPRKI